MKKGIARLLLLLNVMVAATASAQPKTGDEHYAVRLTVSEKGSGESIMMASCYLQPLGAYTVTNIDGKAVFANVPRGKYTLEISYVGFEKYQTTVEVGRDLDLKAVMTPSSTICRLRRLPTSCSCFRAARWATKT